MMDATGHVDRVLLLGGDSDIGNAIALALVSRRGASHVVLAARNPDHLDARRAALASAGADTHVLAYDALDHDTHSEVVEAAFAHGDIDVTVVAVGLLGDQLTSEADPALAKRMIDTNFTGAVTTLVPLAQRLTGQGHGTIVVLSSIAAVQARRANFTYGAAKAGLDAYARGLSDALAGTGPRVLVVRAGFVHTSMTTHLDPAPLATTPDEVADVTISSLDHPNVTVAYAPPAVRPVSWLLQSLPRTVLRRLPA